MSSGLIAIACSYLKDGKNALRLEQSIFKRVMRAAVHEFLNPVLESLCKRALVVKLPEAERELQSATLIRVFKPLSVFIASLPELGSAFAE